MAHAPAPLPAGANRLSFNVAGVRYDGRQATINQHLIPGTDLLICRQAGNAHDANACLVITAQGGHNIGYVPMLLNHNFQQGVYRANVAQLIPKIDIEQQHYIEVLIFVQNNGQPIIAAPVLDIVNGHGLGLEIDP